MMFFHFEERSQWLKFLAWLSPQLEDAELEFLTDQELGWMYVCLQSTASLTYGTPDRLQILDDDARVVCEVRVVTPRTGESYNDRIQLDVQAENGVPIACDLDGGWPSDGDQS